MRSTKTLSVVVLAVLAFVVHRGVLDAYLWDDDFAWLAGGQRFEPGASFAIAERMHFYRPLIDLYFDVTMTLFGFSPRVFHALSVALHLVNASLVGAIARRVLEAPAAALVAALVFVTLPATLDAVAWVSAVTALVMTAFYLAALLAHLTWLETRSPAARGASCALFVCALLSHEAAVTLLPAFLLADLVLRARRTVRGMVREYAPFLVVLAGYLAISFAVNRSNYVVTEGQYRVGVHVVGNMLEYVGNLYVGRRGLGGLAATAVALAAVFWFGGRQARFAAAWMLVALMPYSLFATGNVGRYVYLASAGFSLLVGGLIHALWATVRARAGARAATVAAGLVTALLVGRFAVFTVRGIPTASAPGEPYRAWIESFRAAHPTLPSSGVIDVAAPDAPVHPLAIQPLLQVEYGSRDLYVRVAPPGQVP